MAIYNRNELIEKLKKDVDNTISQHSLLKGIPNELLLQQPDTDKWSVAQIVEHLNGYNRFYLVAIEKALKGATKSENQKFRPGLLGDYFTKLMSPDADGTIKKKMNTPKDYSYSSDLDVEIVFTEFENGQSQLLEFLELAKQVNIGSVKIPISISRYVKLKLGDGFRFLIAHQLRHFTQINRVKEQLSLEPV